MKTLALAALIVALGLVGTADLEDAQRDEALYCKFVADGLIAVLARLTRKEKGK